MIMAEFMLPRRYVKQLGDVVFKKTTGHALYVVQLLNSLLRDSIVTYSTERYRYTWDIDRVEFIQTGRNVAELISSNLNAIPPESLDILHILSLFGVQTELSLLQLLENFHRGTVSSIANFVELGILDKAGPIVVFTVSSPFTPSCSFVVVILTLLHNCIPFAA